MTVTTSEGDSQVTDNSGLWMAIAELAKARNLARQVMYRKVDKLARDGRIEVRLGAGGVKLVNLAAYDRAIAESGDLGRTLGAATRKAADDDVAEPTAPTASAVYTREQARHMAYKADMAQLDLDERRGHLMRRDRVTASARESGIVVVEALDGFIHLADDLTAVANREGTHGVRRVIKRAIYEMRVRLADTFAAMAAAVPATDPAGSELPFGDPISVGQMRSEILARAGVGQSEDAPAVLSEPR